MLNVNEVDVQTDKVENQMLESIVEKSIDGLVVLDQDRTVRFLNPAAAAILNQSTEAFIGQRFSQSSDDYYRQGIDQEQVDESPGD